MPYFPASRAGKLNRWKPRAGTASIYPLDLAGTLPAFAYSSKKLTATYNGPAFRAVRASDSATLDIGFVGQSLDEASLLAFISGTSGVVDIWYDQTGNGNHATQTTNASRPIVDTAIKIGGGIVPTFVSSKMAIPSGVSLSRSAVHYFSVLEHLYFATSALIQLGADTTNQLSLFEQSTLVQGSGAATMTNKPIQTQACIYEAQNNGTVSTTYQDGESVAGAVSALTMVGGSLGATNLGGAGYDGKHYAAAQIAYGRVLSSAERTALRTALRSLFGTAADTVSKRVVFVGDSITAVSAPTAAHAYGFAKMVERSLPADVAVYNVGSGGTQIQNMLATYASNGAGYVFQKYSDERIALMLYGTNDLTVGARTAAQIYADIQTYAGKVRTDGGKIIVCTLTPNGAWNSTQQQTWTDLNTLIRNGWASFADGLCDFAADPTMGAFATANASTVGSNLTLYADGLHPTQLGHTHLAPIALAAVQALL